MIKSMIVRSGFAAVLVSLAAGMSAAQEFTARLDGFFEIGALNNESGAILTNGTGKLTLNVDQNSATYRLSYSGLTSNVTQAHFHFGKIHVAGGIYVFLCTSASINPPAPAGTPICPPAGGTVTGTIVAANILAVPGQNIKAGDFGAMLAALGSNTTYANIHTVNFPRGEIRGQVKLSNEDEDEGHGRGRDR